MAIHPRQRISEGGGKVIRFQNYSTHAEFEKFIKEGHTNQQQTQTTIINKKKPIFFGIGMEFFHTISLL